MDFEEFKKNLTEGLAELYGDEAEVETESVLKNNGIRYNGIRIWFKDEAQNTSTAPVIEIDSLYDIYVNGNASMDECIKAVYHDRERLRDSAEVEMLAKRAVEWEQVKESIYPVLISTEENREMLENLVSRPLLDLSVIYVIRGELTKKCLASIKISHEMLKSYGIGSEELHRTAVENLEKDGYEFLDMESLLQDLMQVKGIVFDTEKPEMHVLTNSKTYGAAGILNRKLIRKFAKGQDYFILPSSLHETIFVPVSDKCDKDTLDEMVRTVNATQVCVEERLSDHSYYYDAGADEIRMCA